MEQTPSEINRKTKPRNPASGRSAFNLSGQADGENGQHKKEWVPIRDIVGAVRSDRMRGGRNKFGPMYKRDRALKQQAIRQQQHIFASCQVNLDDDIKPNPAYLCPPMSMASYPTSPASLLSNESSLSCPMQDQSVTSTQSHTMNSPSQDVFAMNHHYHHYNPMVNIFHPMLQPLSSQLIVPSIPQLIYDLKASTMQDGDVKKRLLSFIQAEFGQVDFQLQPEKFLSMACRLTDQCLFLMVEWARNSVFFKHLKVEDQMKLLQHCWTELLILDFAYHQLQDNWQTELHLANGQKICLSALDKLGLTDVKERLFDLVRKLRDLDIDINEFTCLKFLILLNPDITGIENRDYVEQCQEKVNASLLEYCMNVYPEVKDKFGQVLLRLPEIRMISIHVEEFLYYKHLNREIPDHTLLLEMLHAKRK